VDFLDDVSLPALQAYLEGRRAYRRNEYSEARVHFARALDVDSTFALAALGAREAVMMGLDADRFGLLARADRVLRAHDDRLPPREREYVAAWLPEGRRSAVEAVGEMSRLVGRLPDKAEAWYLYGDYLLHASRRVGEPDWVARATEAFERALELDPGLEVVREHLLYAHAFFGDPDEARAVGEDLLGRIGEGGTLLPEAIMAYQLGDAEQDAWLRARVDTLSYEQAGAVAFGAEMPGPGPPPEVVDRAFDRMEFAAVAEADRRQSLEMRYGYYRSAGRAAEADDQLRLIESAYGPRPRWWVEAALYWDGVGETARTAATDLERALPSGGPLAWSDGGHDACVLALWQLRDGDVASARSVAGRLEDGADDPDPRHGQNALCALLLRASASERAGDGDAATLLDRLVAVLDDGPTEASLGWATLEAAWMLERRGDVAGAARVAAYRRSNLPFQFAGSTTLLEAGRLAEATGDRAGALEAYRWYFGPRQRPDARFTAREDSIRARFPELSEADGGDR
jgi:tetratricopeptide (TPR) repeat protein